MSLQHWLTGQRVFGISNRHIHRCNILQSGLEIIGHTRQHVFMPLLNGPLCTGVYSVKVYDIERDMSVSSVPALAGEVVTVFGPSTVYGPSLEDGHQIASCGRSTHCGPLVMQGQSGCSSLYCKAVFWERLECLIIV